MFVFPKPNWVRKIRGPNNNYYKETIVFNSNLNAGRNTRVELEPNVITYSATRSSYVNGHQPERALALLAGMQGRGLEPDVLTYNATTIA